MSFPWDIITLLKWKIVSVHIRRITLLQQHENSCLITLHVSRTKYHNSGKGPAFTHPHPINFVSQGSSSSNHRKKRQEWLGISVTRTEGWWTVYTYWQSPASTTATKPPKVPWSQTGTHWISGKNLHLGEGKALLYLPVPPKAESICSITQEILTLQSFH